MTNNHLSVLLCLSIFCALPACKNTETTKEKSTITKIEKNGTTKPQPSTPSLATGNSKQTISVEDLTNPLGDGIDLHKNDARLETDNHQTTQKTHAKSKFLRKATVLASAIAASAAGAYAAWSHYGDDICMLASQYLPIELTVKMNLKRLNQAIDIIRKKLKESAEYNPPSPQLSLWNKALDIRSLEPTNEELISIDDMSKILLEDCLENLEKIIRIVESTLLKLQEKPELKATIEAWSLLLSQLKQGVHSRENHNTAPEEDMPDEEDMDTTKKPQGAPHDESSFASSHTQYRTVSVQVEADNNISTNSIPQTDAHKNNHEQDINPNGNPRVTFAGACCFAPSKAW